MSRFISPLTWPGGKSKQWDLIKNFLPKDFERKHIYYWVEPFFGGGSVGLNALKNNLAWKYIFNDIDKNLMQSWKRICLLETNFKSISLKYLFYPYITLEQANDLWKNYDCNNSSVIDYLARNNLTYNGHKTGTFTQKRLEQNWNQSKMKRILRCCNLLENKREDILFKAEHYQNIDASKIPGLKKVKSFYYLDPPYFSNNGKVYEHSFNKSDWIKFGEYIEKITSDGDLFLLSIDDNEVTRGMFKKYNIYEKQWPYTSTKTAQSKCRIGMELFITNYHPKVDDMTNTNISSEYTKRLW